MMKIKNSMKKGVSLMEVMTVTAIMGVIGGMSFVHVQNMKVNEIMQEAKFSYLILSGTIILSNNS